MARERMVTRTIEETTVKALCMTVSTATASTETYIVGQFADDTALLKALKSQHETDDFKIVAVTEKTVAEKLYGMPEADFIKYAKELPPRTKTEQ